MTDAGDYDLGEPPPRPPRQPGTYIGFIVFTLMSFMLVAAYMQDPAGFERLAAALTEPVQQPMFVQMIQEQPAFNAPTEMPSDLGLHLCHTGLELVRRRSRRDSNDNRHADDPDDDP